jgi:hypothetical protein
MISYAGGEHVSAGHELTGCVGADEEHQDSAVPIWLLCLKNRI